MTESRCLGNDNMPERFTHLLLTRFNTSIGFAPSAQRLETDWLTSRLSLFERYCFPSVAAQKGANFTWLVFFDAASPRWFKEKILSFAPLVHPVFVDGLATDDVIARKVRETGIVTAPYLVSTRIDNDDAISRDHLALVQSAFRQQVREFITFPFGLQSLRGHLYEVYWPCNPFLSLIEKVGSEGQFTTVFCVAHDRVAEANKLKKVWCSCQWLQVLHESNLANRLRGWPRLRSRFHTGFEVAWPERPHADSIVSRMRFSTKSYLARAGNLLSRTGAGRESNAHSS
jgi:hypothetical protein